MKIRDVVVHLDANLGCSTSVDIAMQLAIEHRAHITGLYTHWALVMPPHAEVPIPAAVIKDMEAHERERRGEVKSEFLHALEQHGAKGEWCSEEGDPVKALALRARRSDLVVCGQTGESSDQPGIEPIADQVALQCGRPVLVVPTTPDVKHVGKRILIAWNGSKEAARAINDAMPLLLHAEQIKIVAVNMGTSAERDDAACTDMVQHLARHDVVAILEKLDSGELSVGELLLRRIADDNADLLVMGAYGHSRFKEMIFGGVTHRILRALPIPVLLSH